MRTCAQEVPYHGWQLFFHAHLLRLRQVALRFGSRQRRGALSRRHVAVSRQQVPDHRQRRSHLRQLWVQSAAGWDHRDV